MRRRGRRLGSNGSSSGAATRNQRKSPDAYLTHPPHRPPRRRRRRARPPGRRCCGRLELRRRGDLPGRCGEVNKPIPLIENARIRVRETNPATPLTAGLGCRIVSDRLAECDANSRVVLNLGDNDDTYFGIGGGFLALTVNGDAGHDTFIDGNGFGYREVYSGGTGTDKAAYFLESKPLRLSLDSQSNDGEAGSDSLSGAGGNDTFEEGSAANGSDRFSGGAGSDRITYRERTAGVRVARGNAGSDRVERDSIDDVVA